MKRDKMTQKRKEKETYHTSRHRYDRITSKWMKSKEEKRKKQTSASVSMRALPDGFFVTRAFHVIHSFPVVLQRLIDDHLFHRGQDDWSENLKARKQDRTVKDGPGKANSALSGPFRLQIL